jgi:hypothetical protein
LAGILLLAVASASGAARAVDARPPDASDPLSADAAGAAKEAAKRDGIAMYQAFHSGDLERFAAYTYPGLLKLLGGKQKMIAMLQKETSDMAAEGFRFKSAMVGAPTQLVAAGAQLQAMLPLNQVMTAPGGEMHLEGHVLGVSSDGGKTWTFIDAEKLTAGNVRKVLPNYDPRLELPGKKEPTFVPKPPSVVH